MTSRRLAGVVALLAVGGVIGLLGWFVAPRDEQARAVAHGPLVLQWRAGSVQHYDIALHSDFRMTGGAVAGARSMRAGLRGVLEFRILEVDAAGALVGLRLSSVESRVGEDRHPEMERALARPFRVRYAPTGLPTGLEFPGDVAADHRGVLENVVRTFQVSVRSGPKWVAEEPHVSGAYEAAYVRRTASRLEKTKLRYVGDAAPSATIASTESIRVEFGRDWIAGMTVDETVKSTEPNGATVEVTNTATLELRPDSIASDAGAADDWSFVAVAAPAARQRTDAPVLSREEGTAELRKSVAGLNAAGDGRTKWIHAMRDLLIADPGLAAVLLESLRTLQLTDRTRADLYLVFELAGTPESQTALASVMQDPECKQSDGLRAIVALGGVARPTPASVEALWKTTQSERPRIASTATLALGSVGGTLRRAEDESYTILRVKLLDAAHGARDPARRVTLVLALGNTRDPSLAAEVVPLLDDADPRVRSAVARSAGRLGTDEVAERLMVRFEREKNSVVRASLAGALASWTSPPPGAMASMRTAVLAERDEAARFQIVRVLAANLKSSPENRECLRGLLRSEQSKRIRRHIAEAFSATKAN